MANEKDISLVISGQIYEVPYSLELLNNLKQMLNVKSNFNLN